MKSKNLIIALFLFTIISWSSLILIVTKMEPCVAYSAQTFCQATSILAMVLFYSSLFFALTSTFSLVGFISRIYLSNNEIFSYHFNAALRQGILLSFCVLSCLILLTFHILKWWTTALIFGVTLLVESYFLNKDVMPYSSNTYFPDHTDSDLSYYNDSDY